MQMTKSFDEMNAEKSRRVCEAMDRENGRRKLSDRERRILEMWPRFEDGECVMIGDEAMSNNNERFIVQRIEARHRKWMLNDSVTEGHYLNGKRGERVKRPAPKVLDADGVEIEVGDTVWTLDGLEGVVTKVEDSAAYIAYESDYAQREEAANLTHTRPDSWERLEEDRDLNPFDYCKRVGHRLDTCENAERYKSRDLIRRAKKLAGVGVSE